MISDELKPIAEDQSPLWRIKYRPRSLQDIRLYYRQVAQQFSGFIAQNNIPHLMLVGPEGCGKTLLAEILAREMLNSEFDLNFKLLFADDPIGKSERDLSKRQGRVSTKHIGSGAGVVKNYRPFIQIRVRPFVATKKFGESPFKILAIKNFHKLDVEQQAFRRIMEQYSKNCRMILITDRISGIIDPIISRCQLIMIPHVPPHLFNKFIKSVCDQEKIPIKLDILNYLQRMSQNNIGKALDLLQLTKLRFNFITLEHLSTMSHEMNYKLIRELFTQTITSNFKAIRKTLREIFRSNNLSKEQILLELSQVIMTLPLERHLRAFYLDMIAKTDFESIDSNDDEIQLNKLLSQMAMIGKAIN
ncbi:Replication factor C small subunit [Candidatus Lokiarchaeum ossiferum]|uniref:Replication factor C small subunit n=1 Tax=Candidatus Lokiarchaeum ossiferum TaxID=2951803 RepID=A0ABY6HVZ8_9ARCH|nr:Replication factor C small subunit [Candidatus Lokiarchaeum sp. B-35]